MFNEVKFTDKTMKQVSVLVGAGSIGQAIIRRVSAGKQSCWQIIVRGMRNGLQRRLKMQVLNAQLSNETNRLFICSIIDDGNSRCTDVDRASKGIGSMYLPHGTG